jgi:hypothetical protein
MAARWKLRKPRKYATVRFELVDDNLGVVLGTPDGARGQGIVGFGDYLRGMFEVPQAPDPIPDGATGSPASRCCGSTTKTASAPGKQAGCGQPRSCRPAHPT